MPALYSSGQRIPELDGIVIGGSTVMLGEPSEILAIEAMCSLVDRKIGRPLEAVHALLTAPQMQYLDFATIGRLLVGTESPMREVQSDLTDMSDPVLALKGALHVARQLWEGEKRFGGDLRVAIAVADPMSQTHPSLIVQSEATALALYGGSIGVTLSRSLQGLRVALFLILLIRGKGTSPSQLSDNLKETIRSRAAKTADEKLLNLEELREEDLRDRQGIVLFLHGLLAADLGTFDGFIKAWKGSSRERGTTIGDAYLQTAEKDFLLVGWPHDSLAGIEDNALELARLIEAHVGVEGQKIGFVCHSRGGLVARRAALELYERDPRWKEKLCSCLTFGTPHEGASLAESPGTLLGIFMVLGTVAKTSCPVSLLEILEYWARTEKIRGIENLRPVRGGGEFLGDLLRKEGSVKDFVQRVFAVGGEAQAEGVREWMAQHALGGRANDLVVETESSMSSFFDPKLVRKIGCDHFSYFLTDVMQKPECREALRHLQGEIGFDRLVKRRLEAELSRRATAPRAPGPRAHDRFRMRNAEGRVIFDASEGEEDRPKGPEGARDRDDPGSER